MLRFRRFAVAADDEVAAEVGARVLRRGGNVVDAVVASALALCVTRVDCCGLGGYGGFMVVSMESTGEVAVVDFNTRAPRAAHERVYRFVEEHVEGWRTADRENEQGLRSISVPAVLAGLVRASEELGTVDVSDAVSAAARLARSGLTVDRRLSSAIAESAGKVGRDRHASALFLVGGSAPPPGRVLSLRGLARLLEGLAMDPYDLYAGDAGESLGAYVEEGGGLLTFDDLQRYSPAVSSPLSYEVDERAVLVPRDCSGGLTALQVLGACSLVGEGVADVLEAAEDVVSALRSAWAVRLSRLGDPDYVSVPYASLLSERALRSLVEGAQAPPLPGLPSGASASAVAVTSDGDAAALSLSLGAPFGSGVVVPGLDLLMNDGMALFDPRPGRPNSIAPGKRPLSNLCPAIVLREGVAESALSVAGGRAAVSLTGIALARHLMCGQPLWRSLAAPRLHAVHSGPVFIDEGVSAEVERRLRAAGHAVRRLRRVGGPAVAASVDESGRVIAASDAAPPAGG